MKKGFTLIELLVVISIIGTLVGLIVNNLTDARARARDARRKSELTQLKTALRLYYNDYQHYPTDANGGLQINGCGLDGDDACAIEGTFSAGAGPTIYMKTLPADLFYESEGEDDFIAKMVLENASDPDLAAAQAACPGPNYAATDYPVCSD
ncbi:MAG TPA: prepilin-type N-terminal cleavage/methylation domain-containing protein [Patescibacteria group bacterium]|nr:prepilin-type N-terminal cleavage/methylation domain-containing protein [Patescibacteria group bacterium]